VDFLSELDQLDVAPKKSEVAVTCRHAYTDTGYRLCVFCGQAEPATRYQFGIRCPGDNHRFLISPIDGHDTPGDQCVDCGRYRNEWRGETCDHDGLVVAVSGHEITCGECMAGICPKCLRLKCGIDSSEISDIVEPWCDQCDPGPFGCLRCLEPTDSDSFCACCESYFADQ